VVGINPTRRGAELAADIRGTDCAVIVTDDAYGDLLDGIGHGVPQILDASSSGYAGLLATHRGAAAGATAEGLDPRSTLLLLFTSGSTGAPKAVICSTGRWAFICQVNPIKFSPDDVAYNAMPIFHGNALMAALGPCLANGSAFAMRRRFSASGFGSSRHSGHAWRRIFPRTVRLARRVCASDALERGKRAAIRGLNRPAVSWARIALTAAARSCWLVRK